MVADRRSFTLSAKQYDALLATLHAVPKPRIERLFADVLDSFDSGKEQG